MQPAPLDEYSLDLFRWHVEANSVRRRRKIYRKPRPRRIGWQLLGLEHPRGQMGVDSGVALGTTYFVPMIARFGISQCWWRRVGGK